MSESPVVVPLSSMGSAQRWACFKSEILKYLVADRQIDDAELGLLYGAALLYLGPEGANQPDERWQLTEEQWAELVLESEGARAIDGDLMLASHLIRRLLEPNHVKLSPVQFHSVFSWVVERHDTRLRAKTRRVFYNKGRPYERPRGTSLINPAATSSAVSRSLAESFEAWSRIRSGTRRASPSPAVPPPSRAPAQPAGPGASAETSATSPPAVAPLTDAPLAGAVALVVETAPAAPVEPPLPPAEVLPLPEPLVVHPDQQALGQRVRLLTAQRRPDEQRDLFRSIRDDPAAFVRDHFAFGDQLETPVWYPNDLEEGAEVWFAGDVHGDLLALEAVCTAFEVHREPDARLVFLGDLIDRGFHDQEVVLALWSRMREAPGTYGWIVGNHDVGLQYSQDRACFEASVAPAELADQLNANPDDPLLQEFGRAFVDAAALAPRAIFFPGLLAVHGGFPHRDSWEGLQERADLHTPDCLQDFVWNRLHRSKKRLPNRSSRTSSYGSEDFQGFRAVCAEKLGLEVRAMVRGHDHVHETVERWDRPEEVRKGSYEGRVLTINTLSHNQPGELNPYTPKNPRAPTLARWRVGEVLPIPVVVGLTAALVAEYTDPCPICQRPRAGTGGQCERHPEPEPEPELEPEWDPESGLAGD